MPMLTGFDSSVLLNKDAWDASVIQKVTEQNFRASVGGLCVFRQNTFWEAQQHTFCMCFWPGPLWTRHPRLRACLDSGEFFGHAMPGQNLCSLSWDSSGPSRPTWLKSQHPSWARHLLRRTMGQAGQGLVTFLAVLMSPFDVTF